MPETQNRIERTFAHLKQEGRAAFIPYITLSDPDLETSFGAIRALAEAGADMIEIGVPFTDPVADGPTIQKACDRALRHPFSMADIFALTARVRAAGIDVPLVMMTYANPVFAAGFDAFCAGAAKGGIDALLITDIPPEEAEDYTKAAAAHGLGTVFLCSPTTALERLAAIDAASTAYVYYIARAGVTGVRDTLPPGLSDTLADLRARLSQPLCVGFGLSTPAHAAALAPHADGLIVGSAVVRLFEDYAGDALLEKLSAFAAAMTEGMKP